MRTYINLEPIDTYRHLFVSMTRRTLKRFTGSENLRKYGNVRDKRLNCNEKKHTGYVDTRKRKNLSCKYTEETMFPSFLGSHL